MPWKIIWAPMSYWEKAMVTHSSTLPGKAHGRRSLVGCSPWGHEESDTTERLHFYFSLSCIGEGNGNPLQGSCLENPRDGGAWWAAIYGVAQSLTWLKRLCSSMPYWSFFLLTAFSHSNCDCPFSWYDVLFDCIVLYQLYVIWILYKFVLAGLL